MIRGGTYAGIIRLKKGNLDAFFLEEALGLGQVKGGVVRGGVPGMSLAYFFLSCNLKFLPVGQERDLVSRHFDGRSSKYCLC